MTIEHAGNGTRGRGGATEVFDYVVVGGGSAGCAVAARLSEDPAASVALIEAGPRDDDRLFELPALFSRQLKSQFDWDFQTGLQIPVDS